MRLLSDAKIGTTVTLGAAAGGQARCSVKVPIVKSTGRPDDGGR